MLHCRAVGISPELKPSDWELTVDPNTAYMVRRAKCTAHRRGFVWIAMENEGVKWFEQGPLPQIGRISLAPRSFDFDNYDPRECHQLTFGELRAGPDNAVVAEVRDLLRGNFPLGTIVDDYSGGQIRTYRVGEVPHE